MDNYWKTFFTCLEGMSEGHYEWLIISFGLKNASSILEKDE